MRQSPEVRLFRSYWEDGTLDLVAGASVVLIGFTYVFEQHVFVGVVLPLALVAWMVVRRWVVEPRAGYVEFSRSRRERSGREVVGALAAGTGLLILALLGAMGVRSGGLVPGDAVDALPALLIALGAGVAAGLTRAPRFGVYAALFVAVGAVTVWLGAAPGWPLAVGGFVTLASGTVLLARFLAASRRFQESE
jgi:hypothetical protein